MVDEVIISKVAMPVVHILSARTVALCVFTVKGAVRGGQYFRDFRNCTAGP
jgi:hypothetical protein